MNLKKILFIFSQNSAEANMLSKVENKNGIFEWCKSADPK